jgi:endonuclease/exonuclease/phosphatase family metal-dependent hydrolase
LAANVPYYADMSYVPGPVGADWANDLDGRDRAIAGLQRLRAALALEDGVPPRRNSTLLLGTWNVREFDSTTWGARLPEAYAYIAEIVSRFDLVAMQEVREDLRALNRLRARLGSTWDYVVSDVTEGTAGNGERLAFLYDRHKVQFLGIAGELVLPPVTVEGDKVPAAQIARTPLMAGFQVGWTRFLLATVHILYGESTAEPVARIEEISQVVKFLRERTEQVTEPLRNIILLGDFNIFSDDDRTFRALTEGGFTVPDKIQEIPGTNVPKDKKYDQIAYRARQGRFQGTGAAGAFDFYEQVMRRDEDETYRPHIDAYIAQRHAAGMKSPKHPTTDSGRRSQYSTWRTYQLSDHLPLWAEFDVDFSDEYLAALAEQVRPT